MAKKYMVIMGNGTNTSSTINNINSTTDLSGDIIIAINNEYDFVEFCDYKDLIISNKDDVIFNDKDRHKLRNNECIPKRKKYLKF